MNFTSTANVCYQIARELKDLSIETVFVGGNHATFTYEEVLEDKNIDYVIRFQGEETVLELIEILTTKNLEKLSSCEGIAYKRNGIIEVTERRALESDYLNKLPQIAWHLLPMNKYEKDSRWILYTSQGCPCACTFCSTSAFNNSSRVITMSVDNVIKRIKHVIKLWSEKSIPVIGFCDDAFTHDRKRVTELCERIIRENLKFNWSCSTRVDLVDENLIDLMYRAGCRAMLFGIESCSNKVLQAVGKRINLEQSKRAIEIAKKRGMSIREMFILGLPYESHESLQLMEEFFIETKPHEIRFGLLSVYPGTPLWNHSEKFKINILTRDWWKYDLLKPTSNNTLLNEKELYEKYIEFTEKYEKKVANNDFKII